MNQFLVLLKKEVLIEYRGGESLVLTVCLSLLLSLIAGLGVSLSFLNPDSVTRVAPALIWMVFLFSATSSTSRAFDYEAENSAILSLLLLEVAPWVIYLSKLVSLCTLVLFGHLLSTLCIALLVGIDLLSYWRAFLLISILVTVAYSALAVLLSAMVSTSRLRSLLLPLILLPLLFPLFLGAVEISGDLFVKGSFDLSAPWISTLFALDVIYVALGVNLYEHVIRE